MQNGSIVAKTQSLHLSWEFYFCLGSVFFFSLEILSTLVFISGTVALFCCLAPSSCTQSFQLHSHDDKRCRGRSADFSPFKLVFNFLKIIQKAESCCRWMWLLHGSGRALQEKTVLGGVFGNHLIGSVRSDRIALKLLLGLFSILGNDSEYWSMRCFIPLAYCLLLPPKH